MQKIEQVINQLSQAGVVLFLADGELKARAPKKANTLQTLELLRRNRTGLHSYLSSLTEMSCSQGQKKVSTIERQTISALPLSYAQQRQWELQQSSGNSAENHISSTIKIAFEFNADAAERAFSEIIARHEVLRTRYHEREGELVQLISPAVNFQLKRVDLSRWSEAEKQVKLSTLQKTQHFEAFVLSRDLMLRACYVQLSSGDQQPSGALFFTAHRLAVDEWSIDLIETELLALHDTFAKGKHCLVTELSCQYVDYALWQRQWLAGSQISTALDYWHNQLADLPKHHDLPLDFTRQTVQQPSGENSGEKITESLDKDLCRALLNQAKNHKITGFMLLHGILALALSKFSNSQDIVVGTTIAGRTNAELVPLVGNFVNAVVLRVNTEHVDFIDYFRQVKAVNLDAQRYQDVPYERLVDSLTAIQNPGHNSLFQIMFNMYQGETSKSGELQEFQPGVRFNKNVDVMFDLSINAQLSADGGELSWTYDRALFKQDTIVRFNTYMQLLLRVVSKSKHPAWADEAVYVQPQTNTQKILTSIIAQVLMLDSTKLSITANFFSIGGNSIAAIKVLSKAAANGLSFPLSAFYSHKSIACLAAKIDEAAHPEVSISAVAPERLVLASNVVQNWWGIMDKGRRNTVITGGAELTISAPISDEQIQQCLNVLQQRHGVFRTSIEEQDEKLWLRINPKAQAKIIWHDVRNEAQPLEYFETTMTQLMSFKSVYRQIPLHQRGDDLAKILVFKAEGFVHVVFVIDHLLSDGFSSAILCDELSQLVALSQSNRPLSLAEKAYDFIDYCHWLTQEQLHAKESKLATAFWQTQARQYKVARLVHDYPSVQRIDGEGLSTTFSLDSDNTKRLRAFCTDQALTLSNVLFTMFQHFVADRLKMDYPSVGIALNGRLMAGMDSVVGHFMDVVFLPSLVKKGQWHSTDSLVVSELVAQAWGNMWAPHQKYWPKGLSASDHREDPRLPSTPFAFSFDEFGQSKSEDDDRQPEFVISRGNRTDTRNFIWLKVLDSGDNLGFSLELEGRFYQQATLMSMAKQIHQQFNKLAGSLV